jgi:hypothetical protein
MKFVTLQHTSVAVRKVVTRVGNSLGGLDEAPALEALPLPSGKRYQGLHIHCADR